MNMPTILIIAGIACAVVMIVMKVLGTQKEERKQCQRCGKPYGGTPARCPHCGESLRWKQP